MMKSRLRTALIPESPLERAANLRQARPPRHSYRADFGLGIAPAVTSERRTYAGSADDGGRLGRPTIDRGCGALAVAEPKGPPPSAASVVQEGDAQIRSVSEIAGPRFARDDEHRQCEDQAEGEAYRQRFHAQAGQVPPHAIADRGAFFASNIFHERRFHLILGPDRRDPHCNAGAGRLRASLGAR